MSVKYPVSIKGIIISDEKVVILKNERDEWELPGGRLEKGETPEECVVREIYEELGIKCTIMQLIDTWVYEVYNDHFVLIITFLCHCHAYQNIKISDEHKDLRWIPISELNQVNIPEGYKRSIITGINCI